VHPLKKIILEYFFITSCTFTNFQFNIYKLMMIVYVYVILIID